MSYPQHFYWLSAQPFFWLFGSYFEKIKNNNCALPLWSDQKYKNHIWSASWENRLFAYAKTKTQISFAVTAKLISAFVFATRILQSLYFPNPKFQASSHILWLYNPVYVGPETGFLRTRLNCALPLLSYEYTRWATSHGDQYFCKVSWPYVYWYWPSKPHKHLVAMLTKSRVITRSCLCGGDKNLRCDPHLLIYIPVMFKT